AQTTRYAVSIPHLGSLILTHSWDGEIRGLKSFPPQDRPNSTVVFWSFRIMVGLGLAMIGLAALAWLLRRRGRLYEAKWFHRFALAMGPTGFVSLLAGWVTTEVGRQPWTIAGILPTHLSASSLTATDLYLSLAGFIVFYTALFIIEITLMFKYARLGPSSLHTGRYHHEQAGRPLEKAVAGTAA
ncbi:cytochrome ubiquinol oxidase subunit I, partial [Pseudomonas sp. 30_B]|uniref:cytochrome ubiquinol oxidase subunit I n=1 Tax=Pseudomonas sp. 30_B TaxID=2813575 RepID=UPI001A9FC855